MAVGPTRFTYYKCEGFEVWGKEYRPPGGASTWRLRVFAEQDRKIETYEDVTGEPPEGTRTGESTAMREAIAAWLAPASDQPVPQVPEAVQAEAERLNRNERNSLSPRARAYIEYLEKEVSRLKLTQQ